MEARIPNLLSKDAYRADSFPLESRNLNAGIAVRTLKNLDFLKQAFDRGEDVHVVVQSLNSLLGLLVFPVQKERDTQLFRQLRSVRLFPPDYFLSVREAFHDFPLLPSLTIAQFGNCNNLGRFFTRIRNAIAHRHLEFSTDSRILSDEIITMRDKPSEKAPVDWEIRMNGEDLEALGRYIANLLIRTHL
jgi:hypothetical protein